MLRKSRTPKKVPPPPQSLFVSNAVFGGLLIAVFLGSGIALGANQYLARAVHADTQAALSLGSGGHLAAEGGGGGTSPQGSTSAGGNTSPGAGMSSPSGATGNPSGGGTSPRGGGGDRPTQTQSQLQGRGGTPPTGRDPALGGSSNNLSSPESQAAKNAAESKAAEQRVQYANDLANYGAGKSTPAARAAAVDANVAAANKSMLDSIKNFFGFGPTQTPTPTLPTKGLPGATIPRVYLTPSDIVPPANITVLEKTPPRTVQKPKDQESILDVQNKKAATDLRDLVAGYNVLTPEVDIPGLSQRPTYATPGNTIDITPDPTSGYGTAPRISAYDRGYNEAPQTAPKGLADADTRTPSIVSEVKSNLGPRTGSEPSQNQPPASADNSLTRSVRNALSVVTGGLTSLLSVTGPKPQNTKPFATDRIVGETEVNPSTPTDKEVWDYMTNSDPAMTKGTPGPQRSNLGDKTQPEIPKGSGTVTDIAKSSPTTRTQVPNAVTNTDIFNSPNPADQAYTGQAPTYRDYALALGTGEVIANIRFDAAKGTYHLDTRTPQPQTARANEVIAVRSGNVDIAIAFDENGLAKRVETLDSVNQRIAAAKGDVIPSRDNVAGCSAADCGPEYSPGMPSKIGVDIGPEQQPDPREVAAAPAAPATPETTSFNLGDYVPDVVKNTYEKIVEKKNTREILPGWIRSIVDRLYSVGGTPAQPRPEGSGNDNNSASTTSRRDGGAIPDAPL